MKKTILISCRLLLVLTIITGILYPLFITFIGNTFWQEKTNGSLIEIDKKIIGSQLLAQKFTQDKYFHPRPSATDYATVPSGASNFSVTSQSFIDAIKSRKETLGEKAPWDLLTTSGSGLDPHVTYEGIVYQLNRVATARNLSEDQKNHLNLLIENHVKSSSVLFFGTKIVNVLNLNIALDKEFL